MTAHLDDRSFLPATQNVQEAVQSVTSRNADAQACCSLGVTLTTGNHQVP